MSPLDVAALHRLVCAEVPICPVLWYNQDKGEADPLPVVDWQGGEFNVPQRAEQESRMRARSEPSVAQAHASAAASLSSQGAAEHLASSCMVSVGGRILPPLPPPSAPPPRAASFGPGPAPIQACRHRASSVLVANVPPLPGGEPSPALGCVLERFRSMPAMRGLSHEQEIVVLSAAALGARASSWDTPYLATLGAEAQSRWDLRGWNQIKGAWHPVPPPSGHRHRLREVGHNHDLANLSTSAAGWRQFPANCFARCLFLQCLDCF